MQAIAIGSKRPNELLPCSGLVLVAAPPLPVRGSASLRSIEQRKIAGRPV